jgi:signal transduction histidine kinase
LTDPRKKHFGKIQMAVRHMTQLLEDVLTLGKVESGNVVFTPEVTNLQDFCHELIEEIEMSIAHSQQIKFATSGGCNGAPIDRSLLRQIITNLLSNALKYSPDHLPVEFDLHCDEGQLVFTVKDRGIGIPEENRRRLFDSFYRANNVGRIQGTGLGLAIAKKAVDLHRGTIEFETEVGVGTTFRVMLPLTDSQGIARELPEEKAS